METRIYRAYRTLGLRPGARAEEVKQAHRDLAQVWHPDRFADNARLRDKAGRNLQRINEAYGVLRDYTPPPDPRVSRVTASISAILDLGDLVQGTAPHRPPRQHPARTRPRRTILGLNLSGTQGHRFGRTLVRLSIGIIVIFLAVVLVLLLR